MPLSVARLSTVSLNASLSGTCFFSPAGPNVFIPLFRVLNLNRQSARVFLLVLRARSQSPGYRSNVASARLDMGAELRRSIQSQDI